MVKGSKIWLYLASVVIIGITSQMLLIFLERHDIILPYIRDFLDGSNSFYSKIR